MQSMLYSYVVTSIQNSVVNKKTQRTEQQRWTDYINTACICAMHTCVDYLLLESESKKLVTLLTQNMLKQHTYTHPNSQLYILFWESEHPEQSFHLTPRVTSYICTVRRLPLMEHCEVAVVKVFYTQCTWCIMNALIARSNTNFHFN